MSNGSTFEQMIQPYPNNYVPGWLQPPNIALPVVYRCIFMRMEDGEHFSSNHEVQPNRPAPFDPNSSIPIMAVIHLVHLKSKNYFTAKNFREHIPLHDYNISRNNMPPENHIYVKIPHGPIYSAELKKYDPTKGLAKEKRLKKEIEVRDSSRTFHLSSKRSHSPPETSLVNANRRMS